MICCCQNVNIYPNDKPAHDMTTSSPIMLCKKVKKMKVFTNSIHINNIDDLEICSHENEKRCTFKCKRCGMVYRLEIQTESFASIESLNIAIPTRRSKSDQNRPNLFEKVIPVPLKSFFNLSQKDKNPSSSLYKGNEKKEESTSCLVSKAKSLETISFVPKINNNNSNKKSRNLIDGFNNDDLKECDDWCSQSDFDFMFSASNTNIVGSFNPNSYEFDRENLLF